MQSNTHPHIVQVTDHIWVGTDSTARDISVLQSLGITHIVNATDELPNYHAPSSSDSLSAPGLGETPLFVYFRCPIPAPPATPPVSSIFPRAIAFIHSAVCANFRVFVHSHLARARAPALLIAYASTAAGLDVPSACAAVCGRWPLGQVQACGSGTVEEVSAFICASKKATAGGFTHTCSDAKEGASLALSRTAECPPFAPQCSLKDFCARACASLPPLPPPPSTCPGSKAHAAASTAGDSAAAVASPCAGVAATSDGSCLRRVGGVTYLHSSKGTSKMWSKGVTCEEVPDSDSGVGTGAGAGAGVVVGGGAGGGPTVASAGVVTVSQAGARSKRPRDSTDSALPGSTSTEHGDDSVLPSTKFFGPSLSPIAHARTRGPSPSNAAGEVARDCSEAGNATVTKVEPVDSLGQPIGPPLARSFHTHTHAAAVPAASPLHPSMTPCSPPAGPSCMRTPPGSAARACLATSGDVIDGGVVKSARLSLTPRTEPSASTDGGKAGCSSSTPSTTQVCGPGCTCCVQLAPLCPKAAAERARVASAALTTIASPGGAKGGELLRSESQWERSVSHDTQRLTEALSATRIGTATEDTTF